ncbi:MAG: biotin--[acetyl-CoA-carboxylase] ligase [Eubacterium sp.]|nr:biotin--[acetyl-CoA-carboxylase] ligase [Eubacterium sp.]
MSTKDQLLNLFENNRGTYFSGEEIAKKLSVSRTAIWKAVKSLRSDGYNIDAVQNKGYSLSSQSDILSVQGIRKYLQPVCSELKFEIVPILRSTNLMAREKASYGIDEGYVVIANNQTDGKGRRGQSFYSPSDTGIYMSLLLRPHYLTARQAVKLTTMAAAAACEAIEAVSGENAQIKWVNDIYIDGKKVSGILTEAQVGLENDLIEYAILGIGINVTEPDGGFPDELKDVAGAVFHQAQCDGKNRIVAEFLNHFMMYYTLPETSNYTESYKRRSLVIGKDIEIVRHDNRKKATALDIDDECHLLVRFENGKTERLSSGEISVRLS